MSSDAEAQKAVYQALTNDTALMNSIVGCFDFVPQNTNYPYCTIGEDTAVDEHNKDSDIEEITITIHTWDQAEGRLNVKNIMGLIKAVLHRGALSITGFNHVFTYYEFGTTFRDPDALTYHGVQRFRIRLEKI